MNEESKTLEEIYSKLLLADNNGTNLENVDMTTLKQLILDTTYPVGSIFLTINETNPSTTLGGNWEQISQGRTLFGAGTLNGITYSANTNVDAGLPNVVGTLGANIFWSNGGNDGTGAFSSTQTQFTKNYGGGTSGSSGTIKFNASDSNNIYGNSETVQPNAYVTYMWKRIS